MYAFMLSLEDSKAMICILSVEVFQISYMHLKILSSEDSNAMKRLLHGCAFIWHGVAI